MTPKSIPLLLLCVGLTAGGCSSEATLVRADDGAEIEAEIVGHDEASRTLNLVHEDGSEEVVAFDSLEDIDHPGNAVATVGAVLTGTGLMTFGLGVWAIRQESAEQPDSPGSPFALGGVMFTLAGVPMLIWGWVTWADSVEHADALAAPSALMPLLIVDEERVLGGVSFTY